MTAKFSPAVRKEIEKIYRKDRLLADRLEKQIKLFEENPKHPSLRTHKLFSTINNLWSISMTKSIRMVYILLDENNALFVIIGTHEEVYRS